ncbi:hypothetical protein ES705_32045 [subsurface metagenome]
MFKYPPIIDYRWWVTDISKEVTPLGLKLKVMTSRGVNLFMVWTDVEPVLEERWKMKRGVKVHCDPVFHLTNPQLVNEDFPSDHKTHWFTFDDWPVCQTRWFYFIAKIWNLWTKSTSFLHSYHKTALPQWWVFSPDKHPGITCSDGYAGRGLGYWGGTWADIHDGAGNRGSSEGAILGVTIMSGQTADRWRSLTRSGIIFDTSRLPRPGIVQDAYIKLWGMAKGDYTWFPNFKVGLTAYDQDDNTQIALADYGHFLPYESSKHKIPYENIIVGDWNRFDLTGFEIGAIRDHPIREFGIREMTYDFRNIEPDWPRRCVEYVNFAAAENIIDKPPKLYVNWLPTGG